MNVRAFLLSRGGGSFSLETRHRLYRVSMQSLLRPYGESDGPVAAATVQTVWPDGEERAEEYSWVLELARTVQGLGRVYQHCSPTYADP